MIKYFDNIKADKIEIGEGVTFGNVDIKVNGTFRIGDNSHLGDCHIRGNNVIIGRDFLMAQAVFRGGQGGYDLAEGFKIIRMAHGLH